MKINTQSLAGSNRRSFEAVDLVKFICAVVVVFAHLQPLGQPTNTAVFWIDRVIRFNIARVTVPFFLMCTGYFIFRKFDRSTYTLKNTIGAVRKSYRLYLVWVLIYMPFIVRDFIKNDKGLLYDVLVFIRNLIFTSGYSHLWYLNASGFALLLISVLMHKKVKPEKILGIAFVLYLFGLLMQPYYGALDPLRSHPIIGKLLRAFDLIIVTPRNGLFDAFFFMSIGVLYAYKPIRMPMKIATVGFVASMILMFLEALILAEINWLRGYDIYLFGAPASIFLFYVVTHIELKKRSIYGFLRFSSAMVYFVHLFVWKSLCILLPRMGIVLQANYVYFFLTMGISLLISYIVLKLSAHRKFAWLKVLYS